MKVRLTETIEVDPKSWATEFGIDPKEVREDIKLYFSCWCQEQINRLGLSMNPDHDYYQ